MLQANAAQTYLTASALAKQSQEILHQLLERLEHLDLTGKLSDKEQITQTAHGGNGDVYVAYCWLGTRKVKVALKRLRFYIYKDKDFAKLLAKEIRVWSQLCHPNVLELLGYVIEENGFPSLISPWIANGTALEFVRAHPELDVCPIILGIARGLEYMHKQDVVHSDMKSDNILISEELEPLICDFGTSRILANSQTIVATTTSDKLKGSLRWLAVEFFAHEQSKHTKETDVWAFGMTVYELLVKERPYYHLRLDPQVIFAIVRGDKPLMPEVDEQTASRRKILRLWDICRLCWMNQPESRLPMPLVVAFLSGDDDDENNNIDKAQALRLWSGLPVKSLPYFEEIGASAKHSAENVIQQKQDRNSTSTPVPINHRHHTTLDESQALDAQPHQISPQELDTEQQHQRRPKYRRSRTGCLTCRKRKIKCDETKPDCRQCTFQERECVWPEDPQLPRRRRLSRGSEPYPIQPASMSEMRDPSTADSEPSSASTSRPSTANSSSSSFRFRRIDELGPSPEDLEAMEARFGQWFTAVREEPD